MTNMDKRAMPTRASGWASSHRSPTHSPMRPTAPPTPANPSAFHPYCQSRAAEFFALAWACSRKVVECMACGNLRAAAWCLYNARRCLQRALKELLR